MGYRCFDVEITDGVAHVRCNRPDELNTMVPEFWRELPEIVTGISDDATARVVVISSTGKHFSAGMDLSVFTGGHLADSGAEPGRRHAQLRSNAKVLQWSFTALEKARVPVLAACQGGVIGGAVDLVTACDVRYASADAASLMPVTISGSSRQKSGVMVFSSSGRDRRTCATRSVMSTSKQR